MHIRTCAYTVCHAHADILTRNCNGNRDWPLLGKNVMQKSHFLCPSRTWGKQILFKNVFQLFLKIPRNEFIELWSPFLFCLFVDGILTMLQKGKQNARNRRALTKQRNIVVVSLFVLLLCLQKNKPTVCALGGCGFVTSWFSLYTCT